MIFRYTFGKPVQGDAELTIKRQWGRNTKDQIVKKFKVYMRNNMIVALLFFALRQ